MTQKPLQPQAQKLHPASEALQIKWLAAIRFLREQSKKGWCLDQKQPKRTRGIL